MSSLRIVLALTLLYATGSAVTVSAVSLDDPMRPPGRAALARGASGGQQFDLTSTLITRDRKSAVINGRQVTVGDKVNGAKVIDISPTEVRIRHRDQILTLHLLPISVKRPAASE